MIDTKKLREIAETRHVGLSYSYTPRTYMEAAAEHFPALLDELDAARAELDRLRKRVEVLERVREAAERADSDQFGLGAITRLREALDSAEEAADGN
jgi:hypothetical protein